jgi:hypothetical protein
MRRFVLNRLEDETKISGTGIVAEGIQFSNGRCSMCWVTQWCSIAIYDSIEELQAIHGHNGKTLIQWLD